MPQRLFTRLFLQSALVMVALALVGGVAIDRFLTKRELTALENRLFEQAIIFSSETRGEEKASQQRAVQWGELSGIRFTVVAGDGTVLADSLHTPQQMDNHALRPEIASALAGERGYAQRKSPTLGMEMLYVTTPTNPVIRAALPLSDVEELLAQMRSRLLWAALPAILLAAALAFALSRRLTRRFEAMRTFAGELASGDFDNTLDPKGSDELAELEQSLVALKGELERQLSALEDESSRLRALSDGLPDGMVLLDGEGLVRASNRVAAEYLRLESSAAQGLLAREVFRNPEILSALYSDQTDKTPDQGLRVRWANPAREVEVFIHPIPEEGGKTGKMVVLRDVTRRVHLERVRSDFFSNMAHELRTPLTAIKGAAETLSDGALADPDATQRFLATIQRHSVRLENILADIADLSRIESGNLTIQRTDFDASAPVIDVTELFWAEAGRRNITLQTILPDSPVALTSDQDKIDSILINLVQNALRYTPEGTITVGLETKAHGAVVYTVKDEGIGIPAEALDRITERFYRVDPGRSRAQGGTGLGLSIVSHLVELLGGKLEIQSEPGKGTTVSVSLGAAKQPAPSR